MYLLIAVLIFLFLGSVAFAIYYFFASNSENFVEWSTLELTLKKRILWLGNIILLFLSVWATIYCLIESEPLGTFGILIWLFTSLAAAQFCSPLKPFSFLDISTPDSKSGCAALLMSPLLVITSTVSGLLAMLTSWLFCIITILRKSTTLFKIIACLLIAAAIIAPPAVVLGINYAEQKQIEEAEKAEAEIINSIMSKIEAAFDSGNLEKIVFDADELAYCEENDTNPFFAAKANGVIEKKISELYNKKDINGMLTVINVMKANNYGFDVHIDSDIYKFIKDEIKTNGEFKTNHSFSGVPIYSYGEYDAYLDPEYIKISREENPLEAFFWVYDEDDENLEYYDEYWVAGETAVDVLNPNI